MDNEEVSGERTHQEIPISEGIVDHKVDSDNTNSDEEVSEEVNNKVDELDVSEKITPVDQSSVNQYCQRRCLAGLQTSMRIKFS